MRKLMMLAAAVPVLAVVLSAVSFAGECGAGSASINETNRKFAVILPAMSGMEAQSFDDIGCGVLSRNGECATRQGMFDSGAVTYDYATGAEIPVEKAFFVLRTDVMTPRDFGIVAFKDRAEAEKFSAAHGKGKVVKWFELVDEKLK